MASRMIAFFCACSLAAAASSLAAPKVETSPRYQALLHAIVETDMSGVRKLLEQGLDPNARVRPAAEDAWIVDADRPSDQPLLAVAARFGVPDSPIVAMLLERKAAVDARDARERTPLMYAAQLGWSPSVDQLLARKAEVNAADEAGVTVLMHAVGNRNLPIVATLIAKGARVNAVDRQGKTPLMHAIVRARHDPIRLYGQKDEPIDDNTRYVELIRFLIERKADVNAREKSGDTPLKIALRQRVPELVMVLRNAGARE